MLTIMTKDQRFCLEFKFVLSDEKDKYFADTDNQSYIYSNIIKNYVFFRTNRMSISGYTYPEYFWRNIIRCTNCNITLYSAIFK